MKTAKINSRSPVRAEMMSSLPAWSLLGFPSLVNISNPAIRSSKKAVPPAMPRPQVYIHLKKALELPRGIQPIAESMFGGPEAQKS